MYYFKNAVKDSTIYLQQPHQNTGRDEVLEVSKVYYGNIKDISRALIQFNTSEIADEIQSGQLVVESAILSLRETESEELPLQFVLYGVPIYGEWEMGIGTRFDEISTTGVTWNYREGDSKVEWGVPSLANGIDGNYNGRGGVWYTSSISEYSYLYNTMDVQMDITNVLVDWISGSIPNNGIMLKYDTELESDTNDYGILKFFSRETNTIYQPKLIIKWDDSVYTNEELTIAPNNTTLRITIPSMKKEYKVDTRIRVNVNVREKYPLKQFTANFPNSTLYKLPQTAYYQIKDVLSDTVIIPFSNYSKISCDSSGNYMMLDFHNWEVNRLYKIEFKILWPDSSIAFVDDDYTFEVVK
jgi:hypothetical protein